MSLDVLRNALHREKTTEIAKTVSGHKRKLRELYRVTELCTATLNAGHQPKLDDYVLVDPDENESHFLDENDLIQERRYNQATLPFPTQLTRQQASITTLATLKRNEKSSAFSKSTSSPARTPSTSPSVATQTLSLDAIQPEVNNFHANPSLKPSPQLTPSVVHEETATNARVWSASSSTTNIEGFNVTSQSATDTSDASIEHVSPAASQQLNGTKSSSCATSRNENNPRPHPATHLSIEEVQKAHSQDEKRKVGNIAEKDQMDAERFETSQAGGTADASSPSSTVGPYSQATPHAPNHSPDTSPETGAFHGHNQLLEPSEEVLDPAAQQVKEDHERALQKRMDEAHQHGRDVSSPTPEIEKQIEDERAVHFAHKRRRLSNPLQAEPRLQSRLEGSSETRSDLLSKREQFNEYKMSHDHAADSLPTPTMTTHEPTTSDGDIAEDSLTQGKPATAILDHPTPPADNDTDMVDSPNRKKRSRSSSQAFSAYPYTISSRVRCDIIQEKALPESMAGKSSSHVVLTPHSSTLSLSTSPYRPKTSDVKSRGVSTVVFAKKIPHRSSKVLQSYNEDYASLQGASEDSSRDYLEGLFRFQAHQPPRSVTLQELVGSARKTVSTVGTFAMIREQQDYKILKRVYQLQNANRWSLRQLRKAIEPERPFTHQDQLLLEMKWLQTDFKEERKWKQGLAASFAQWCCDYVNSDPANRALLRTKARIPRPISRNGYHDGEMNDAPTPELVHSGANETESDSYADDDELLTPLNAHLPACIFSLGYNDVVMKIERTPASDSMFRELPFYKPILEDASDFNPFSVSTPPILPVSKFVTGKLVSQIRGPPKKRSRYDYDSEDEQSSPPSRAGTSAEHSMPSTPGRRLFCRNDLPPEITNIALFNAENKHVRDRLQAAHQFRPPTEFNMPTTVFFENRTPSQWLWEEDQKLRALVKEYTFNWSLVSQQLSLPSLFVSGSGRRTPWECFERWVQLEGLPAEMSKTQYFRTYQGRLEQANRTVSAQFQAQQQQQQSGQSLVQPRRRPTTTPMRVERRREKRYLAIIDGMRKLARKRESAAHKQAESQKAAALRKAHEPTQPKNNVHTPQEFSRLKWEREEKLKQRQMQQEMMMRQQMVAQRAMQGQPGMVNGMNQMQRSAHAGGNANISTQMGNTALTQGQNTAAMAARAHQGQQVMQAGFPNGNLSGVSLGNSGVPQAQMQGNMAGNLRMGPPDQMRMAMQRGQFQHTNQQHQFQLQQAQINMASSLTHGMRAMSGIPNANMMASMPNQAVNGNMNGNMNGMSNNAGARINPGSPNMPNAARPLSSGHMPQLLQIQNTLKQQHPEMTTEQIQKVASEQLARYLNKQRMQAMNAATGGVTSGSSNMSPPQMGNNHFLPNSGMTSNTPSSAVQNYQLQLVQQQRLMSQQQRQQGQGNSPGGNRRSPSRSATPQNPQMLQSPGAQSAQLN